MKITIKYAFILSWTIVTLAQAGVAADISTPTYSDIRFSKNSVALITERGTYSFSRKMGLAKPISGDLPIEFLRSTKLENLPPKEVKQSNSDDRGDSIWLMPWKTSQGFEFQTVGAYCGEGSEDYHSLLYRGKEIATYLPGCESISAIEVINSHLWLGSFEQYEYGDGAGSGVRVISLKSKKLIAAFSPKQKSMAGYVMPLNFDAATGMLSVVKKAAAGRANDGKMIAKSKGLLADGYVVFIRHDSVTNDVWVLTQSALHRISNEKVITRWYLSEQFNMDGQVTLLGSRKPQKSNAWAILARHTKLLDTKPLWKQLRQSPRMAGRVTYEYDEEGNYFSVDGKRMEAYATTENKQTTMLMWDFNLSRTEFAQELITRLNNK